MFLFKMNADLSSWDESCCTVSVQASRALHCIAFKASGRREKGTFYGLPPPAVKCFGEKRFCWQLSTEHRPAAAVVI